MDLIGSSQKKCHLGFLILCFSRQDCLCSLCWFITCGPSASTSIASARIMCLHHYHAYLKESSSDEKNRVCGCSEFRGGVGA